MFKLFKREFHKLGNFFSQPTFIFLTIVGNVLLFLSTLVVHWLEKDINPKMHSYLESLWWGVSTITTVGYGDIVPITVFGRLIGMALMLIGTVLFISFTGVLVTSWTREEFGKEISPIEKEVKEEEKETRHIEKMLRDIRSRLERLENK